VHFAPMKKARLQNRLLNVADWTEEENFALAGKR
jgi:hypothetical protein